MVDYPSTYVLVKICPHEPDIDWRRQVVDSLCQTTPLGMADMSAVDVTAVVIECGEDLDVLSNPDDTTRLLGRAIESLR